MKVDRTFKTVLIRPRAHFGSIEQAQELAGFELPTALSPRFFELPAVVLIVDEHGLPEWQSSLFLSEIALLSKSGTGDTVRSYGEALLPWLRFLYDRDLSPRDATEQLLGIYRNELVHGSSLFSGNRLASATTNHRLAVVIRFQSWGQQCGLMVSRLGEFIDSRKEQERSMAHVRSLRKIPQRSIGAPRVIRRSPQILSAEEIHRFFQLVPMPYRLMMRWCLVTGTRRFEVCGLKKSALPSPEQLALSNDGLIKLNLLRKGMRDLTVHVPVRLVEETAWYVLTDRPQALRDYGDFIFLNSRGRGVSRQQMTRVFRANADRMGSNATLHHLRHTYAVHVLGILEQRVQKGESLNSIKTLQMLLGHASVETTEIYLRAMDTCSDAVREALAFLYGASDEA